MAQFSPFSFWYAIIRQQVIILVILCDILNTNPDPQIFYVFTVNPRKIRLESLVLSYLSILIFKAGFRKLERLWFGYFTAPYECHRACWTGSRGAKRRWNFAPAVISPVDAERAAAALSPSSGGLQPILGGNLVTWTLRKHQSPSSGEVRNI